MNSGSRKVTQQNKGLECESPTPHRPAAKEELFWIIQPCPATQKGRQQPWEKALLPGPWAERPRREGRASPGSLAAPAAAQTGWGGVGGDASPGVGESLPKVGLQQTIQSDWSTSGEARGQEEPFIFVLGASGRVISKQTPFAPRGLVVMASRSSEATLQS